MVKKMSQEGINFLITNLKAFYLVWVILILSNHGGVINVYLLT
ncbi:hypothetical protein B6N60_01126 [Richelia sinica FACHB-800]|uniref:Uncharacterized protein n=1 Tax=Richelia sinica FACHB-800 TaxID=1357546 RepID=A0A975T5A9_9NOST|nr:hypothetical protein B6N60_01126 [Richelia sinica FACHB-800]